MKQISLTLIFSCICSLVLQAQTIDWTHGFGASNNDIPFSIASDNNGNVITTGFFAETVDFDPGSGVTNVTAVKSRDMFVQKLDAAGNLAWVKTFGSHSADYGVAVTTDAAGNIYLLGVYKDTIDVDPGPGRKVISVNNPTHEGMFLLKLNAAGDFVWVRQMNPNPSHGANIGQADIAIDNAGNNLYVIYKVNGINFDIVSTSTGALVVQGGLAALGSTTLTTYVKDYTLDIAPNDDIIISGTFKGVAYLNPFGSDTLESTPPSAFITRVDKNGNLIFMKTFRAINWQDECQGFDVATDSKGDIYVCGRFGGEVDFDPGPGVHIEKAFPQFGTSMYLAKLAANGNFEWVRIYGQSSNNYMYAVGVDADDNVITTGNFSSKMYVDKVSLKSIDAKAGDMFILKVATNGRYLGVEQISGSASVAGTNIDVTPTGDMLICGEYNSTTTFGNKAITTQGMNDWFVMKVLACPKVDTTLTNNGGVLTANEANANYQWYDCDAQQDIVNANLQNYTPTKNGNYAVRVIKNGCSTLSACKQVTNVSVSSIANTSFQYSPNPTTGFVYFTESVSGSVYTITGTHIADVQDVKSIDLTEQPTGVYYLRTVEGIVIKVKKL